MPNSATWRAAFPPRRKSPLEDTFTFSRSAILLAGGLEPTHELFASRLAAHLRERIGEFDVWPSDIWAVAIERMPGRRMIILCIDSSRGWQDEPAVKYRLDTIDGARGITPAHFDLIAALAVDDPLFQLHSSVAQLVAEWPEITTVAET